jgi:hypothetical protein
LDDEFAIKKEKSFQSDSIISKLFLESIFKTMNLLMNFSESQKWYTKNVGINKDESNLIKTID